MKNINVQEHPFCKHVRTAAFVYKPTHVGTVQYIDGRKQIFKKMFYVLTHLHLPKHQDPCFHTCQVINVGLSQDFLFAGGKVGALNILINFLLA